MVLKKGQRSLWFDQPIADGDVLAIFENNDEWLTRRMIAARLERTKSPSLVARINALVAAGALEMTSDSAPNGVTRFWYRLKEHEQAS